MLQLKLALIFSLAVAHHSWALPSSLSAGGGEDGCTALYKLDHSIDQCGEVCLSATVASFAERFGGCKAGTCASIGYTVFAGKTKTSQPVIGEFEVDLYNRSAAVRLGAVPSGRIEGLPDIDPAVIENIGKQVWDVIEKNKPVTNISSDDSATAVPAGLDDWEQMAGWRPLSMSEFQESRHLYFSFHDPVGVPLVTYNYTVVGDYGGTYGNGTGKYLSNVRVEPTYVHVSWGIQFDGSVQVEDPPLNVGSTEAPVAALTLIHKFRISNWLLDEHHEETFQVWGDGRVVKD